MKRKIVCLLLSLVFVAGMLSANGTYAWFMDYASGDGEVQSLHNFSTGNIGYTLVGNFVSLAQDERIQPEMELLADLDETTKVAAAITAENEVPGTKLYLKSTSLVDTQVRVKVFYTYIVNADGTYVMGDDHCFVGGVDSGAPFVAVADGDYWVYNETDNYFYYDNSAAEGGSDRIPAFSSETAESIIPLFSSLRYSGDNSDLPTSAFKDNNSFKIKVVFQAKQADYAQWSDIGEIEFTTGETE